MNFMSDTAAPAHPRVIEAIMRANEGYAASYGADAWSAELTRTVSAKFETDVAIWLASSGTAANALALSLACSPLESVLCHGDAHINRDERGAPEFFTGGARLEPLAGAHGCIDPAALRQRLATVNPGFVHETPPRVLSLTNLTEAGTRYSPDQIGELSRMAKAAGLVVHLDGARFANALAGSQASAADMTWRAGVDILTLGGTKNGAMGCEAIVLFGETRQKLGDLQARAKRSGQMPPKMRFMAAQMLALFEDDLWLELADRANASARQLSAILVHRAGAILEHTVDGNEVFARLPDDRKSQLRSRGCTFHDWPDGASRFVCSWCTSPQDLEAVEQALT